MTMDIDQFFVGEDGSLVLVDDCGKITYCDTQRFEVITEQEPKTDTWSIKELANTLEKHGFGRLEQAPSRSPNPIITIDGIRYIAEEPRLKTVHKDGEVVIGGFKEIV